MVAGLVARRGHLRSWRGWVDPVGVQPLRFATERGGFHGSVPSTGCSDRCSSAPQPDRLDLLCYRLPRRVLVVYDSIRDLRAGSRARFAARRSRRRLVLYLDLGAAGLAERDAMPAAVPGWPPAVTPLATDSMAGCHRALSVRGCPVCDAVGGPGQHRSASTGGRYSHRHACRRPPAVFTSHRCNTVTAAGRAVLPHR